MHLKTKGFALIGAIVLLVILSTASAYLIQSYMNAQEFSTSLFLRKKAYYEAFSGLEFARFAALSGQSCNTVDNPINYSPDNFYFTNCAVAQGCTPTSTLATSLNYNQLYTVQTTCNNIVYQEASVNNTVFNIQATASSITPYNLYVSTNGVNINNEGNSVTLSLGRVVTDAP